MPSDDRPNRRLRLARRPNGLPDDDVWTLHEEAVPEISDGEILVRVMLVSVDPAMRGWLTDARSYVRPVRIGDVMRAIAAGEVIASRNPQFREGQHVTGMFGVQEFAVSDGAGVAVTDLSLAPLPVHLSALGMTGLTAYFGLLDIGRPKAGETVVVSAAAGAVGQIVGQIATINGCRVIGIAGGAEKCRAVVEDFGFDAAIDYRNDDIRARLRELCPDRIDVYFDNVGGDILEAALSRLARHARVVICGAVSQYNNDEPKGPANYMALLVDRARMEGFLVFDYADRYGQAIADLARWRAEGRLRSREQIIDGLERFPEALRMLFRSENTGKLLVRVA